MGLKNKNNPKSFFKVNLGESGSDDLGCNSWGGRGGTLYPFFFYFSLSSPQPFFLSLNTSSLSISANHKYLPASLLMLRLRELGGPNSTLSTSIVAFQH